MKPSELEIILQRLIFRKTLPSPRVLLELFSYVAYCGRCSKLAKYIADADAHVPSEVLDVWSYASAVGSRADCNLLRVVEDGRIVLDTAPRYIRNKLTKALVESACMNADRKKPDEEAVRVLKKYGLCYPRRHGKPRTLKLDELPECVSYMEELMKRGELPHQGRVCWATALLWLYQLRDEKTESEAVELLLGKLSELLGDKFSEKIARYQLEHLAGLKGSGKKYYPCGCRKLQEMGLCPLSEDKRKECKWMSRFSHYVKTATEQAQEEQTSR